MNEDVFNKLGKLEKELGVPENLFKSLIAEDDWTFIIKLHSLIEGSVTFIIEEHLHNKDLRKFLERLELSNVYTGKIAIACQLKLLTRPEIKYIQSLSELRNKLVHDVRNVNFIFEEYLKALNKQQKKNFFDGFSCIFIDEDLLESEKKELIKFSNEEPKQFIWFSAMLILLKIYYSKELLIFKRDLEDKKAERDEKTGYGLRSLAKYYSSS